MSLGKPDMKLVLNFMNLGDKMVAIYEYTLS
jgi:hypothetical protein